MDDELSASGLDSLRRLSRKSKESSIGIEKDDKRDVAEETQAITKQVTDLAMPDGAVLSRVQVGDDTPNSSSNIDQFLKNQQEIL